MVANTDYSIKTITSRIQSIEKLQQNISKCLLDCETQILVIAGLYSVSLDSNCFLSNDESNDAPQEESTPSRMRVLARHHGWQWLLGSATSQTDGSSKYTVKFDDIIGERVLPANQVVEINSYKHPSGMDIGIKVMAEVNTSDAPGVFYTASVAEVPETLNKYRYLLLFDDGTARYYLGDRCYVCPEQSFVTSVNPVHKRFVLYYNKMYKQGGFQILDLSKQNHVITEINGEWKVCKVNYTDCNIANIQVSSDTEESIYCGSYRFGPIYNTLRQHLT